MSNTRTFDPAILLKRLHKKALEHGHLWAVRQLDRIAAEIITAELTTSYWGSVDKLFEELQDMEQRETGRVTTSYDGGSGRRGADPRIASLAKRTDIDSRIVNGLQRNHLRAFIIQCGYGATLQEMQVSCKACRHSRVIEINDMLEAGTPIREVALWTAQINEPVSKSTLHAHRRHAVGKAPVA